jgi:hypothetical protein
MIMIKTIKRAINYIKSKTRDLGLPKRSSQWRKVEKDFLEKNPCCAVCGLKEKLNVHHIKPFHLYPELELDVNNLITLCMGKKECHLLIGHGADFKAYCDSIKKYAQEVQNKQKTLQEIYDIAKRNRKYERLFMQ